MKKMLLLAGIALLGAPTTSRADSMEWTVTSRYPYQVQLSFFSQFRSAEWPGSGDAYKLNDSLPHSFALSCRTGEKICYGAWPTGGDVNGRYSKHWGAGVNNEQDCENCCAICGEENPDVTLQGR